ELGIMYLPGGTGPLIRHRWSEFRELAFLTRQTLLILHHVEILNQSPLTSFVTDRSVLDYLVWTGINATSFYEGVLSSPQLRIITPTPSLEWYHDHHQEFLSKQS